MRNLGQMLFVIFLASCQTFDWKPEPWAGDHYKKRIVKYTGETLDAGAPDFSKMTCFAPDNISELKTAIDKVNTRKTKKASDSVFHTLTKRVLKSRALSN